MTTRNRLFAALLGATVVAGMLTGCASSGNSTEASNADGAGAPQEFYEQPDAAIPEAPSDDGASADDSGPGAEGGAPEAQQRAVITTTTVDMTVSDLRDAITQVEQLVAGEQGFIESRDEDLGDDRQSAWLTVRVPADKHDGFVAQLGSFGEVTSVESSSDDVTMEQVSLQGQVDTLRASVKALQAMLEKATEIDDMLEIEQTLTERQTELQSLENQLEVLNNDVAMSSVTIVLSTEHVAPEERPTGFFTGFVEGWNNLMAGIARLFHGIGTALPALLFIVALGAIVYFAIALPVYHRLRRAETSAAEEVPAEESTLLDDVPAHLDDEYPSPYDDDLAPAPGQRLIEGMPPLPDLPPQHR